MAMVVPLLPPPGSVDTNGPNASANWDKFNQNAADAVKSALLLSFVGDGSLRTLDIFKFSGTKGSNKELFSEVVASFRCYCLPKRNTTYE
ncbi:hypothetical protein PR048_027826 [Dryococelus australis]|uniref:Uncharacterized protein n=1 Tax=Dryococelus australis TaxID=614101 RepID=A0ABQ9GHL4_9NEOP|nr:hypothetical protein PR048_027826 [Dryococelus australis]